MQQHQSNIQQQQTPPVPLQSSSQQLKSQQMQQQQQIQQNQRTKQEMEWSNNNNYHQNTTNGTSVNIAAPVPVNGQMDLSLVEATSPVWYRLKISRQEGRSIDLTIFEEVSARFFYLLAELFNIRITVLYNTYPFIGIEERCVSHSWYRFLFLSVNPKVFNNSGFLQAVASVPRIECKEEAEHSVTKCMRFSAQKAWLIKPYNNRSKSNNQTYNIRHLFW